MQLKDKILSFGKEVSKNKSLNPLLYSSYQTLKFGVKNIEIGIGFKKIRKNRKDNQRSLTGLKGWPVT